MSDPVSSIEDIEGHTVEETSRPSNKKVRAPMSEERKEQLRNQLKNARDAKNLKKKELENGANAVEKPKKIKLIPKKPKVIKPTEEPEPLSDIEEEEVKIVVKPKKVKKEKQITLQDKIRKRKPKVKFVVEEEEEEVANEVAEAPPPQVPLYVAPPLRVKKHTDLCSRKKRWH